MLRVKVSDSSTRYPEKLYNEALDTPRSVFEDLGVSYQRAQTSLNGRILRDDEMDKTFAALGVSGNAVLNSIVKGDGAVAKISVSDSSTRYGEQAVDEAEETPRSLFNKLGVAYERAQTSLNGTILRGDQLDMTFAQLGVVGRASLNSIVKGDGARK